MRFVIFHDRCSSLCVYTAINLDISELQTQNILFGSVRVEATNLGTSSLKAGTLKAQSVPACGLFIGLVRTHCNEALLLQGIDRSELLRCLALDHEVCGCKRSDFWFGVAH
jgi:hypothetical protein